MTRDPRRGNPLVVAGCLLLFATVPLAAQETGTVTGTVRSAATREPLVAVRVQVLGTSRVAQTGDDGQFTITSVPAGQRSLRATKLGYSSREANALVLAGQSAVVDFDLPVSAIVLGEVVVTGTAGAQEKREIGNSIGTIAISEQLEVAPITNATQLLTARTPGLSLMANSGQAGTSSNIRIRGAGSLSAGYAPVFYIDGIRIEAGSVEGSDFTQGGTALDFINPDDIESIEVIRGPAAATLYGADAANGVVQIITKKGRGGQRAQWTTSAETSETEWLESTSDGKYRTYRRCTVAMQTNASFPGCRVASGNLAALPVGWYDRDGTLRTDVPAADILAIPGSSEFILKDEPLFRHPRALRKGGAEDFNASVRGGTGTMGYFLSFNHNDESGVFFNNFAKRLGGRGNFDVEIASNLSVNSQVSYTRSHTQFPLNSNASNGLLRNAMRGRARAQTAPWEAGFLGFSPDVTNEFDLQNRLDRTTIGVTGNWTPISWFVNKLTLGMDRQSYIETDFTRQDTTGRAPWGTIAATGSIDHEVGGVHRWTVDYAGTASRRVTADLQSNTSAGMQLNARKRRDFFTNCDGLVANNLNLCGAAATRNADESISEQTSLGFFVEERVGWRDRVYATGALRFDDNSAFGSNFEMVVYPKASLSWVISDEEFFKLPYTDELKLRTAWGRAGNAPAPFSADRTFTSGQGVSTADALVNTLTISSYGNPNLKAETGQELELGFDASVLNGKLGIEFTFYNKQTVDALIQVPDPGSTGFTGNHLVNIGEISNRGIELLLTGTPFTSQRFGWDATLAFSTNANKLVSFNGAREEIIFGAFADVQRHREGFPLGGFWAVDVERGADGKPVIRSNTDSSVIANPVLDAAGQHVRVLNNCRWAPSDPTWNREAECDDIYMGPSRPTREAALTNTFTLFKDFRIYTQFDYRGGHYQWCAACSLGTRVDLNTWEVNSGGTALNPDVTVADVIALRSLQTKSHITKADYMKFRELALTYSVPQRWTRRALPGSQWSVTLSGRNLAMWTKYEGKGDPEVQWDPTSTFQMLDYASTPQVRRLSASFRVTF
jgi:TonB-dependent starch-binding outer membrane protein SusC